MATGEQGHKVGSVAELWRFPVKSMQGERLRATTFGATAMADDRRYAVRDVSTGKVLSAKRYGPLLEAAATREGAEVVIDIPGVGHYVAGDPSVHDALSRWLGLDVRLDHAAPDDGLNGVYEFAFDIEDAPDAEWFDIDMPAGSFADLAHVHVLTDASIQAASAGHTDSDWDVRRFRPSIFVETTAALDGFVEDEWVGRHVAIGALEISVDLPTIRCVMPTRPQPELAGAPALVRDKAVSRAIADLHGFNLGVYCSIVTPGEVSVGDPVVVLDSPAT